VQAGAPALRGQAPDAPAPLEIAASRDDASEDRLRVGFDDVLDLDDLPAEQPYTRLQHGAHALAAAIGGHLCAYRDDVGV